jgi:flavin reductase (NADH)
MSDTQPAAHAAAPSHAQQQFRQAMAHLGAAVNVVTTAGVHGRCGITASAVCAVTDTPPTVLVCVNRSSAMHAVFAHNRRACINVLSAEQEILARHFAGQTGLSMEQRFDLPVWDHGDHGIPVLRDALVSLQGAIVECKEVGSHSVMFVQAETIQVRAEGDSLIYFSRAFHRVARVARTA